MTLLKYGVNVYAGPTKGQPPLNVDSELTAIIGAFPADNGAGYEIGQSNTWYAATSWEDFKGKYGGEEIWGAGNLERSQGWNANKSVERLMSGFGMYPVLIYNVLDPDSHQTAIADESRVLITGTVKLVNKYIQMSTIVVTDSPMTTTYDIGDDYTVSRGTDGLVSITTVSTGAIGATDTILVDYDYCDNSAITQIQVTAAIQGCNDIITDLGFSRLPGWIHAPYWSQADIDNVVAATVRTDLSTISANLNSTFVTRFVYDIDETDYNSSSDLADIYADKSILDENGRAFFGEGTYGATTEQLLSDWYIGMMSLEVELNGYVGVSPSNRPMTGYVPNNKLSFPTASNAVRDKGIITVILDTADRGWNLWGTWTSFYNGTATDLRKDSTNQNDFIAYKSKQLTRDLWAKSTDRNFNKFTIQDFVDKENSAGRLLISKGQMIGYELEFRAVDNPDLSTQINLRMYVLAPEPQKRTDVEIQVDLNFFNTIFPA